MATDFNIFTVCTDTSSDYASPVEDAPVMDEDDEKSFSGLLEED